MLFSSGVAWLLTALWSFRQGDRWLWWTLFASGVPAYLAGVGVHLAVGYTHFSHLAPARGGGVALYRGAGFDLSLPHSKFAR